MIGGDCVMEWFFGAITTLLGFFLSYFTFQRSRDKDLREKAKEEGIIENQLNSIGKGIKEIRIDLKANEKQMIRMNEQLIRLDESTKTAHKRIDKLEGIKRSD